MEVSNHGKTPISTHSPRVGRDLLLHVANHTKGDFNPLSPCGERLEYLQQLIDEYFISTHSPRVGRD